MRDFDEAARLDVIESAIEASAKDDDLSDGAFFVIDPRCEDASAIIIDILVRDGAARDAANRLAAGAAGAASTSIDDPVLFTSWRKTSDLIGVLAGLDKPPGFDTWLDEPINNGFVRVVTMGRDAHISVSVIQYSDKNS